MTSASSSIDVRQLLQVQWRCSNQIKENTPVDISETDYIQFPTTLQIGLNVQPAISIVVHFGTVTFRGEDTNKFTPYRGQAFLPMHRLTKHLLCYIGPHVNLKQKISLRVVGRYII